MRQKDWEPFFNNISRQLTVSLIARPQTEKNSGAQQVAVEATLPVFDAIDLLKDHESLVLPDGRTVKKRFLMKRPLRIIFFVLLTELESKLYRTQEWSSQPLSELNEANMNKLIVNLLDNATLFSYQDLYKTRADFKEDLKAVSAIRNNIVHVNKKLELEIDFETIVRRKGQLLKLLEAFNQILDAQERGRKDGNNPQA